MSLEGPAALEASARIAEKYVSEGHYVKVVFPEVEKPSESQVQKALSLAVVQPSFRESNPNGPAYVTCTIHEPSAAMTRLLAARCVSQLEAIAAELGIEVQQVEE